MVLEVRILGPISNTAGVHAALLRYYGQLTQQICFAYHWVDKMLIFFVYADPFWLDFTEQATDSRETIIDLNKRSIQHPWDTLWFTFNSPQLSVL